MRSNGRSSVVSTMSLPSQKIISGTRPRGQIPRLKSGFMPLLSYGFRPFFLGAGVWACVAMLLWIGYVSGHWTFANAYGPLAWHAHELLFGYVSAVLAGFLLTAIPNWTGRLPVQGRTLLALFLLWVVGRIAMLVTDQIGIVTAGAIDSTFLFVLTAVILREIIAGRNWRNLKTAMLVLGLAIANLLFHLEVLGSGMPDRGIRFACAAIIGLIMLVGGRITPSFTRNWLARQGPGKLPTPLDRFDMASLGLAGTALGLWIVIPDRREIGVLLIVAAVAQAARLGRWAGERTWREPLVLILHLGYAFVPLGSLMLGLSVLWPDIVPPSGALHAWTTGAVGVMTLAVMTRATLGHTGRDVASTPATMVIFVAILVAAVARAVAPILPAGYFEMLIVAALGWIVAFGAFVLIYGPMLMRARRAG
jgi:uncharacterized protein involved in response to NO